MNLGRLAYQVRHSRFLEGFEGLWNFARPAYKKLLLAASGGKGVFARVNGVDQFWFVNRHSYEITWEPEEYAALDRLIRPGTTVVDAGAHDGLYTLALAKRVGPAGRVHAFEPSPDTFEILQANCRNNGFADRVVAENCLVGEFEGEADFQWVPGEASPLNTATGKVDHLASLAARTIRRPMITLDAYCARRGIRPDLIKMDVEGFELNLIRGARETLRQNEGLILLMELHPKSLERLGHSVAELVDCLAGSGCETVSLDGGPLTPIPPDCDSTFNFPALARRRAAR